MTCPKPHYLLFCDGNVSANGENSGLQRGRWRFVLENLVSGERVEATDQEVDCAPDRSALVAVLRGLEALEQPSRVTLVTTSRYVTRGLQYGLSEWRENDYSWEHFGTVQPIRNADIWKRIDRALAYHQVQCRWMAQEGAAETQDETPNADRGGDRRATLSNKTTSVACVDTEGDHGGDRGPLPTIPLLVESPKSSKEKSRKRLPSLVQILFLPVHLACRGFQWLCCHLWEVILAIDEWLESFLRCLLLLDPSKKPTRR